MEHIEKYPDATEQDGDSVQHKRDRITTEQSPRQNEEKDQREVMRQPAHAVTS
jgi:hypothetical protein